MNKLKYFIETIYNFLIQHLTTVGVGFLICIVIALPNEEARLSGIAYLIIAIYYLIS